ncbi:MAG TPA: hypothetical protein VE642_07685, partial [Pyrinomonadaceae bacterium]|nr:hypothetical protein [Pyrinomonadaceae bacterium]
MKTKTTLTACALAAALAGLAGCGSDQPTSGPQTPTLPTGALNGRPDASASGGNLITNPPNGANVKGGQIPAGFPLPSGTTIGRVAARATDITAPMNVPDGDEATSFWRKQLPAAGYTIGSVTVHDAIGAITFTGNGCLEGSQLGVSGQHVQFRCQ